MNFVISEISNISSLILFEITYLTYNYETLETKFLDLRFYFNNFEEPYYISPNRDLDLYINIPFSTLNIYKINIFHIYHEVHQKADKNQRRIGC